MYEHRICLLWRNCWRNVEDLRYENLMQVLIHFLKPNFVIKRGTLSSKNKLKLLSVSDLLELV
jgi:cephalosporin hydroxylase